MPDNPLFQAEDAQGQPVLVPQDTADSLGLFDPSGLDIGQAIPEPPMLAGLSDTVGLPDANPDDLQQWLEAPQAPEQPVAASQAPAAPTLAEEQAATEQAHGYDPNNPLNEPQAPQFDLNAPTEQAGPADDLRRRLEMQSGGRLTINSQGQAIDVRTGQPVNLGGGAQDLQGQIRQLAQQRILEQLQGRPRGRGNGLAIRRQVRALAQRGGEIDDDLAALGGERDELLDQYVQGILDQGDTRAQMGEDAAGIIDDTAAGMENAIKEYQDDQDEARAVAHHAGIRLAESVDRFSTMRVDPYRLFRNADSGTRLSAAVGTAVGAGLQVMQSIMFPGSNPTNNAMHIMNLAVERDLAAQRANITIAGRDIQHRRGFLNHLHGQFQDAVAAEQAYRSVAYRRMAGRLRSMMARGSSTLDVQAAQQTATGLDLQANAAEQNALQAQRQAVYQQQMQTAARARRGHGRHRLSLSALRQLVGEGGPALQRGQSLGNLTVNDPNQWAVYHQELGESAQHAVDSGVQLQLIHDGIQRMLDFRRQHGGGAVTPADRAQMNGYRNTVMAALGSAQELGVLQEADIRRLSDQVPDPAELFSPSADAALEGSMNAIDSQARTRFQGTGLTPTWLTRQAAEEVDGVDTSHGFTSGRGH